VIDTYALRLLFGVCLNSLETGELEQVRELAKVMLEQAKLAQLMLLQGWAHYFLGVVHYCWNELETAAQHFTELVDKRYAVPALAARNGIIGLVRVQLARGENAAVWLTMGLLSQLDQDRLGQEGDDARSLRAELAYWQGDPEKAFRWADAYTVPVPDRLANFLQDPHLAKAHLLLARGTTVDVQAALELLDTLYSIAQRAYSIRLYIEILALRALALEKQGTANAAGAALQQAVDLARSGGFIRVFVDLGSPMQAMLARHALQSGLARPGTGAESVRHVLAAFPEPQKKAMVGPPVEGAEFTMLVANAELVEPLTERELEVLALLRDRLSDKEIGHKLGLSTGTVKRHTANIYGKLGVNRRRDAVIKTLALGIIPPR
jgi:LuxR family maltose regulon positive regulatory protein